MKVAKEISTYLLNTNSNNFKLDLCKAMHALINLAYRKVNDLTSSLLKRKNLLLL